MSGKEKIMIRLIQDDCLNAMDKLIEENVKATMTITDIPYNEVNRKSNGLRGLDKGYADSSVINLDKFLCCLEKLTTGSIYIFCGTEQVSFIRRRLVELKLSTRLCIWEKNNPSPMNGQYIWLSGVECCVYGKKKNAVFNEHCKNTVFKYPVVNKQIHLTQKPLNLMKYLINVSSNKNDLVLDPCMGSGQTILAAKILNRSAIGIDNGYCEKEKSKYYKMPWKEVVEDRLKNEIQESIN